MSTVDPSAALAYLKQFPQTAHGKLLQIMTKVGLDLQGYVQINKLQGQVLNHRSGWLSSHVHPQVTDNSSSVTTTVGVDSKAVPYAAIHEYGFHGMQHVKAHSRQSAGGAAALKLFNRLSQLGAVAGYKATKKAGYGSTQELAAHATSFGMVRAYDRMMNMPERSYLRSGLNERMDIYIGWLRGIGNVASN